MDCVLSGLRHAFVSGDLATQHNLIVKIENWSRVRIDAENAQTINDYLHNVLPIYYSHSFHECPLCRSDNYMTWTSLLASFLDSRVLLHKNNSQNNPDLFNSKDLCMVEFTLSGETIYLVDVLLQMNTIALVPEFGEFVAKRVFSLDKSTYKRHENAIRILMLHKWLDLNFSHILKPTYEQLARYLDPNSVLDWIGLRIWTNIKKTYWRGRTVADKIQVLLNSFDLSTLATLLGQSTNSDGGEQVNCKKQNIHHHKESREHFREKRIVRKPYPSALSIGGDVCTDIVKELDKEGNQFSLYSLEKPGNLSSPNTQWDTDVTSGAKRKLTDKNDRKRTMYDCEEKVQPDYGFRPSKKTKLNGECNNIENAGGEIDVMDVGNDIDTNQNMRDDVSADTSLYGKPVIPMERSQDMDSPGKQKTPKKNRTPTVSGSEVKNVIVSPTSSTEKRKASRSNTNIRSEVDVMDVGNDIDTNQNMRDDVSADTSLHGKPVIPMERSQDMDSPGKQKTPKKNRTPTVSGSEVKNVIVSPTSSTEKRKASRSNTNIRSEVDVMDVGNDIDTNQNMRDDVSADTSLHGKPVIPMERSQDMDSPGKQKTPKKNRTPTVSGSEVKNVIVSPTSSTEKRKASRSNTNIRSEVDVMDVGNDIDTNQNMRDDVSADTSLHGKPVIPMERSQDMDSPGKQKTPKKNRTPTVSDKSARLNDLATSLDASASLSYVNSENNMCTSAKLCINNGLNKPATRQPKTIDTAVCKSPIVRSSYSLRTRNSLR
ncbi:unnamed protein product [Schistosoma margrebowiei]|uniref:Uncharacterized protein n=1 Tax=Schistosoma margrebowiei TaxID=48269 RepID=A0AA84ZPW3_9TREM|nr:unnamed protein product [Schistosoma margrebowiei]